MDKKKPVKQYILMVDDDVELGALITRRLEGAGILAKTVASSEEFKKALEEKKPDLCIIDLHIESPASGLELVAHVKKRFGNELPVLMMTGETDQKLMAYSIEAGADDYLIKPPQKDYFLEKCQTLLRDRSGSQGGYLYPVVEGEGQSKLSIELEIEAVDEWGLKVKSPHLIQKNTVVRIQSALLEEITGKSDPVLVTATSNWAIAEKKEYGVYLEFGATEAELQNAVRRWVLTQIGKGKVHADHKQ